MINLNGGSEDPFLFPFITKLQRRNPTWEFNWLTSLFEVKENGETLGRIAKQYHYGYEKYQYVLTNKRIDASLKRGNTIKTSDMNKALEVVKTYFYKSTMEERLGEAIRLAVQVQGRIIQSAEYEPYYAWRKLEDHVKAVLCDERPLRVALADMFGDAGIEALDEYIELERRKVDAQTLTKANIYVLIEGDDYLIAESADNFKTLTTDTLPPDLKTKIGLLKLFDDDGAYAPNIGVRVKKDLFMIVMDE